MSTLLPVNLLGMDLLAPDAVNHYLHLILLSVGLLALISTVWWQVGKESYEDVTENRDLSQFDSLEIWGALNVLVTPGHNSTMTLRGTRRAINCLRVRQYGKMLKLGSRFGFWRRQRDLFLTITTPELKELDVSGACTVQLNGFTKQQTMDLNISGACNINYEGDAEQLTADVSGASRLTLVGHGARLSADITGASQLQAFDYQVEEANIDVTGACSARLHVLRQLWAEATGASKIQYRGDPRIQFKSSGASSIGRV
ncbi:hypothetical protein GCM10023187_04520 [Nibrella viscosa]|uniref:Putative auto-transporter adhesin head GIN domain-containing protein n=1 Tax=Nibrella viscosa TaxID=1084524 RepID=A0ABP8JUM5_9BACT